MDVINVAATMRVGVSGGVNPAVGVNGNGSNGMQISVRGDYYTEPTISYAPLQGDAFLKNLLLPVSLDVVYELLRGWTATKLYGLCIERINNQVNLPEASGPRPSAAPNYSSGFARLLELIDVLRNKGILSMHKNNKGDRIFVIKHDNSYKNVILELKDLLGLDHNLTEYRMVIDVYEDRPDTISITMRSIMSIMYLLSQNIQSPPEHLKNGLIRVTRKANGEPFDWGSTAPGKSMKVFVASDKPTDGSMAIPYRDHWFYIKDDDLESKSTFVLLTQLFRLQAGSATMVAPTLTIPLR